jgi:hypothetical protein
MGGPGAAPRKGEDMSFIDKAKEALGDAADKVKDVVTENADKIEGAIDKAGRLLEI